MRKSEIIKVIEKVLDDSGASSGAVVKSDELAKSILEKIIAVGMLPPRRDYIEHYAWKSDNTWEKE